MRLHTLICTFPSYRFTSHPSRAGTSAFRLVSYVHILPLCRAPGPSSAVRWALSVPSCRLAAQIVSCRVCLLPSKARAQPRVSATYFIIGSNQHQSPGRRGRPLAADGRCVLGCLVCLSGSVKYLLIRTKGRPCFPGGARAAPCSRQCLTPPFSSQNRSVDYDVAHCCTLCAEYISRSLALSSLAPQCTPKLSQSTPQCTWFDALMLFLSVSALLERKVMYRLDCVTEKWK